MLCNHHKQPKCVFIFSFFGTPPRIHMICLWLCITKLSSIVHVTILIFDKSKIMGGRFFLYKNLQAEMVCGQVLMKQFAYWVIVHTFLWSADFFQNQLFRKILLGITLDCQTVWTQTRPDVLSALILVQTICKGYQQTTLVGKANNQFTGGYTAKQWATIYNKLNSKL